MKEPRLGDRQAGPSPAAEHLADLDLQAFRAFQLQPSVFGRWVPVLRGLGVQGLGFLKSSKLVSIRDEQWPQRDLLSGCE